ncbi:MAG: WG repeat-containing protein [Planctomycetota bacterium]
MRIVHPTTPQYTWACRKSLFIWTIAFWVFASVWMKPAVAQSTEFHLADPRTPLFGEIQNPEALKYANAGSNDDLLPLEINGYWGILNQSRRVVALPEFDWTDYGVDGLVRATINGKTGVLIGNGKWRFDPIYPYLDRFEEGYALFGDGEKFGYIDKAGKIRIGPEFDAALRFRENWAGVRVGDRCGFINTRFRPATAMKFTAVRSFHEGYAAVRLPSETVSVTPISGPTEKPDKGNASDAAPPSNASSNGVWGFLNKNGKFAYRDPTGEIEMLGDFNGGLARFRSGGLWGYMNKKFQIVLPPTYEGARDFTNGSAAVKLDGKWGYINRKFTVTVPFIYDQADDFDSTLAMVTLNGKKGYIGRTGRVQIEPQFDWAEPFRNGFARVSVDDSFGYVRSSGYVFYDPRVGRMGIIDITAREQLRTQASLWKRYNSILRPPTKRPAKASPYPPEYQYDEGLWVGSPPEDTEPKKPVPSTDTVPGETNPDDTERV